jgi:hypothetical protein
MNDGIVKLIADYQAHEIVGNPQVVGSGIVNNYDILQSLKRGLDSSGFGANSVNVYNDFNAAGAWGVNHFGVFVPGMTNFIDYLKNVGSYGGQKPDGVYKFLLPIPAVLAGGRLINLQLDAMLKYNSCPVTDDDGVVIAEAGWSFIFGKHFNLFNTPLDAFKGDDRLNGFNGSLHYIATAV